MIGIVLVTHGRLASELVAALEHVVGVQENVRSVCIDPDDDTDVCRQAIVQAAVAVDQGAGVVLLTDMFGGTPSNLAISILGEGPYEVIAGVNLPMLVKLATVRSRMSLGEAVSRAENAGRKYIQVASRFLPDDGK